jgi:hypothetical protein
MADYLLFQKAQRKSFTMNSAKFRQSKSSLQVQKRSQPSISTHNKASGVRTLCGHNPKLLAFVIRT